MAAKIITLTMKMTLFLSMTKQKETLERNTQCEKKNIKKLNWRGEERNGGEKK